MLGEGHSNSLHLMGWVSCDKTKACIESNVKTVCCASVLSREPSIRTSEPSIHTSTACRKLNTVTETTNMGESNGTNLKPIAPIHFFKQVFENRRVLVLRPDSWRKKPRSTSTPRGAKVLMSEQCNQLFRMETQI